jgi:glycosyltransferase involved in cell wall biosynthesis
VLDAAQQLADTRASHASDIHVVMAGAGSAYASLAARLERKPIRNVHLLGPVPKAEARALLAGADIGLHVLRPDPVFESALPTKVLEYLGCHLPFITTVPGLPAMVAHATGGALAADASQLAEELVRWAALTASERRARGEAAFAWGEREYGLTASADALEQVLRGAIVGAHPSHPA